MTRMPPPPPSADLCLFLDVDGTLIEFTDTPSETVADPDIKHLLLAVAQRLHGAVALVSGREIRTLDALFAPLVLPSAGLHGVERRNAGGELQTVNFADSQLDHARASLEALVAAHPGTILEDKGRTVAVHYRLAPKSGDAVRDAIAAIAQPLRSTHHVQAGHLMFEIKPKGVDKGTAVAAFMTEPPFSNRRPVFIGDDLTDEHGFEQVDAIGGFSIGVGTRVGGRYQLRDVSAVRAWLQGLA